MIEDLETWLEKEKIKAEKFANQDEYSAGYLDAIIKVLNHIKTKQDGNQSEAR